MMHYGRTVRVILTEFAHGAKISHISTLSKEEEKRGRLSPYRLLQLLFLTMEKMALSMGILQKDSPNLTAWFPRELITQNEVISSSRLAVWNRSVTGHSTKTITRLRPLEVCLPCLPSNSMPTNANFGFGGGRKERRAEAIYCCYIAIREQTNSEVEICYEIGKK